MSLGDTIFIVFSNNQPLINNMKSNGQRLLEKTFANHRVEAHRLHDVCFQSPPFFREMNDELFMALCSEIVRRDKAERFWINFIASLEDGASNHNYESVARYVSEFFPKLQLKSIPTDIPRRNVITVLAEAFRGLKFRLRL